MTSASGRKAALRQECYHQMSTDPFYNKRETLYGLHDLKYPLPREDLPIAKAKVTRSLKANLQRPEITEFEKDWAQAIKENGSRSSCRSGERFQMVESLAPECAKFSSWGVREVFSG